MSTPKFRYIIVTPGNDVFGTNDPREANDYVDDDESFVIDTIEGIYNFDGDEGKIEAAP